MIYLTGDTHGNFNRLMEFSRQNPHLTSADTLVILGDAGFNYFGDARGLPGKAAVAALPFMVLCIHGNHEARPANVAGYRETTWNGGAVYRQDDYPSILFAKDGEMFELEGRRAIAIGGAYSVDKFYRLDYGYRWFADEQPSEEIKQVVEARLAQEHWQVDLVLSHTCPSKYIPTEAFLGGIDQSTVDRSTEEWLGEIESHLQYDQWFCGHWHIEKSVDKLRFLFESIVPLVAPDSFDLPAKAADAD